jgi:hypothetical protein
MATQASSAARRRAGYFSISDLANMLSVNYGSFKYHVAKDHIPKPSAIWGRSRRRYYTLADVAELQAVWDSTPKKSRQEKEIQEEL